MAIARGAGTEIIRSASFESVNTATKLIIGVQHHIYTVLSLTATCIGRNASEKGYIMLIGWDAMGGLSAGDHYISDINNSIRETFVWNDKFSFNGFEPLASAMSGTLSTVAEQDAIADQGSAVSQYLQLTTDSGSTWYDVTVTYIDQNNA